CRSRLILVDSRRRPERYFASSTELPRSGRYRAGGAGGGALRARYYPLGRLGLRRRRLLFLQLHAWQAGIAADMALGGALLSSRPPGVATLLPLDRQHLRLSGFLHRSVLRLRSRCFRSDEAARHVQSIQPGFYPDPFARPRVLRQPTLLRTPPGDVVALDGV